MSVVPNTEIDLADSTLVLAADITEILRKHGRFVVFETVMQEFLAGHDRVGPTEFLDALSLLFAVQMIQYEGFRLRLVES